MCDKAVNRCFFCIYFFLFFVCIRIKKCVTELILIYGSDDYLTTLKLIVDWFVTSKMLEKFHYALNANDDILI